MFIPFLSFFLFFFCATKHEKWNKRWNYHTGSDSIFMMESEDRDQNLLQLPPIMEHVGWKHLKWVFQMFFWGGSTPRVEYWNGEMVLVGVAFRSITTLGKELLGAKNCLVATVGQTSMQMSISLSSTKFASICRISSTANSSPCRGVFFFFFKYSFYR